METSSYPSSHSRGDVSNRGRYEEWDGYGLRRRKTTIMLSRVVPTHRRHGRAVVNNSDDITHVSKMSPPRKRRRWTRFGHGMATRLRQFGRQIKAANGLRCFSMSKQARQRSFIPFEALGVSSRITIFSRLSPWRSFGRRRPRSLTPNFQMLVRLRPANLVLANDGKLVGK